MCADVNAPKDVENTIAKHAGCKGAWPYGMVRLEHALGRNA